MNTKFSAEKMSEMGRLAMNHAEEGRDGLSRIEIADCISSSATLAAERIVRDLLNVEPTPERESYGLQGGYDDAARDELNALLPSGARGRELACLSRCIDALIQ
jgi:hypothetical protein